MGVVERMGGVGWVWWGEVGVGRCGVRRGVGVE